MKNQGDKFLPDDFKREVCPFCGKKGYHKKPIDSFIPKWRCMYCKKRGNFKTSEEKKE